MILLRTQAPLAVMALLCCGQTVLSDDFSGFSEGVARILRSFEKGINNVRRAGDRLNGMLDRAEPITLEKVNTEYREKLTRYWSQSLSEAISDANKKGVDVSECASDNIIPSTVDKVVQEAQQWVREKIPQRVSAVRGVIENVNIGCDAFMKSAKAVGRRCDAMGNYERAMCIADQMTALSGQIGDLGGRMGGIGGSVAMVIMDTAHDAVVASAQKYDVQVKAYVAKATNCIYRKLNMYNEVQP